MNSKIKSYIGFALNKGAVILGADNIKKTKKRPKAVIVCDTASEKTKSEMRFYCGKHGVVLIESRVPAEQLVAKTGVKVFAVSDENLVSAVLHNLDEDFKCVEVSN